VPDAHPPTVTAPEDVALARRCRGNHVEFCRELARWSGDRGEIVERDGVLLFATATTFPALCNGVARLDEQVPAGRVLDLAGAWFAERERGFSVLTSDLGVGADDDLVATAEARGLLRVGAAPAMVCEAPLPPADPPPDVEVRWVGDGGRVQDLVAVCDASYRSLGMPAGVIDEMVRAPERIDAPHLRTVVLHLDGEPVACAQLLLSHGIAGVYYVGTLARARGRGLAELATRLVTNLGFELGAPVVTLQASPMGEPIYRRMGYRDLYGTTTLTLFPPG
jgi:hypothetical protein